MALPEGMECEISTSSQLDGTSSDTPMEASFATKRTYDRKLTTEQVIKMWNLVKIVKKLGTNEQCVQFAEENQLVCSQKLCGTHRIPMKKAKSSTFGSWFCPRGRCKTKSKISRSKGTLFENIKIKLVHVFYFIYAYANKWSYNMVIHEDPYKEERGQCLSSATINDWYGHCRECVVLYQLNNNDYTGKIGGLGKIVQIDQTKFGKRKYSKGSEIEGCWVFCITEDGSDEMRLEVCPENKHSPTVLLSLIEKHIEKGTTIHTDQWKEYDCLAENGFIHEKVNPSNPDNPSVDQNGTYNQKIEAQWKAITRFFRHNNYTNPDNIADLVVEYLWRWNTNKFKRDPFLEMIKAIQYAYKLK